MIQDSGDRTTFVTGAVRDVQDDKGRCDLMPLDVVSRLLRDESGVLDALEDYKCAEHDGDKVNSLYSALELLARDYYGDNTDLDVSLMFMMLDVSLHYRDGAKKYGEDNWRKGIPRWSYLSSAVRHYLQYLSGCDDEPHFRAAVWNIMGLIWTIEHITDEEATYRKKRIYEKISAKIG